MADVVIVAIVLLLLRVRSPMYLLTAVAYLVLRDSIAGRSVGDLFAVSSSSTLRPAGHAVWAGPSSATFYC